MTRTLLRRAVRFVRLRPREQLTTVHAALTLVVVECLVRWVRLPTLASLLRVPLEVARRDAVQAAPGPRPAGAPDDRLDGHDLAQLSTAVRAARRVTRAWPFGSGPCLRESLVLGHLIRHRSPLLRIGVGNRGERLLAHAWIEVDGRPLGDAEGFATFTGRRPHSPAR